MSNEENDIQLLSESKSTQTRKIQQSSKSSTSKQSLEESEIPPIIIDEDLQLIRQVLEEYLPITCRPSHYAYLLAGLHNEELPEHQRYNIAVQIISDLIRALDVYDQFPE